MKHSYFAGLHTAAQIKAAYHRLVKENHPDVGGDTATMQEINAQYKAAMDYIARHGETERERSDAADAMSDEYIAAILAAVKLPGIILELVGSWLWCTGDTYTNRAALKAAGYRFASKKRAWYWRPETEACFRGGKKSLDEIRDTYGARRIIAADHDRRPVYQLA